MKCNRNHKNFDHLDFWSYFAVQKVARFRRSCVNEGRFVQVFLSVQIFVRTRVNGVLDLLSIVGEENTEN